LEKEKGMMNIKKMKLINILNEMFDDEEERIGVGYIYKKMVENK
jgi:hypothetical protein